MTLSGDRDGEEEGDIVNSEFDVDAVSEVQQEVTSCPRRASRIICK